MKNILYNLLLLTLGMPAWAQTSQEKIHQTYTWGAAPQRVLMVVNIVGDVIIEGTTGNQVEVDVTKTITAPAAAQRDAGVKAVQLGVVERPDTLILYVKGLCSTFGYVRSAKGNGWQYQWRPGCCDHKPDFEQRMDFVVKVPASAQVVVSTVNEGQVSVSDITGRVVARNVNGAVALHRVVHAVEATTVNGDVTVQYAQLPKQNGRFHTLNGDIQTEVPAGLSAELSLASRHGACYTNLPALQSLSVPLIREAHSEGIRYKIGGSRYQVGKGGAHLDFETFHGDIYIREKQ